jgi:hypothetical protein
MNRITREVVLAAAVCAGLLALAWLCLTPRRARAQAIPTAWYLLIKLCSPAKGCAVTRAPEAPFYTEDDCRAAAAAYLNGRTLDGFDRVGYRCERWPLER